MPRSMALQSVSSRHSFTPVSNPKAFRSIPRNFETSRMLSIPIIIGRENWILFCYYKINRKKILCGALMLMSADPYIMNNASKLLKPVNQSSVGYQSYWISEADDGLNHGYNIWYWVLRNWNEILFLGLDTSGIKD